MSSAVCWAEKVQNYLAHRRRYGFALRSQGDLLRNFARFADETRGHTRFTLGLVRAWARTAKHCKPITWTRRAQILRGFAKYLLRFDPRTEIPPPDLFGSARYHRPIPHIFSHKEVIALMAATRQHLTSDYPLRQQTCRALFGLLASSGLRISEALKLTNVDVDLHAGVLSVRGKRDKSRLVPLHRSTTTALQRYECLRNASVPHAHGDRFFLFDDGRRVAKEAVRYALQSLCRRLGWRPRGDYRRHRLQDMRHSFIVNSMVRLYQQGVEIDRQILALHNYVGHATIEETYWYCSAIPELMSMAADRFHRHLRGKRP
jgi:site-specific recombinase XerD